MNNIEIGQNKPRMLLHIRGSSKKQTEKKVGEDGRIEYDIPLQRNILRPWGEKLGYDIIGELVEGGVSGFKVSATKRDAVLELKAMADRGEFDVLGIYMSDRLGRIADETPLIVSYLNTRGIKVFSYTEGEISTRTHNDKLMTYLRYWQAEGESIKTSMRIKDAHEDAVEHGRWRGGNPPYGYMSVSRGTLNGKGRPIFDIEINPEEAEIVKKAFNLYTEHHSTKAIAKILNNAKILAQKGGQWTPAQIKNILKNKLYVGIYELGKTAKSKEDRLESPIMEYLRFISDEDFNKVQTMLKANAVPRKESEGARPTIRGSRILTGLLYCDCGKKYTSQTQVARQTRRDGSVRVHEYSCYRCGSYRVPMEGQCDRKPFNADNLDKLITDDAKKFLTESDINKLLFSHEDKIREKEQEMSEQLKRMTKDISQKDKELSKLKDEVYKAIIGESLFSQSLLSDLIQTKDQELLILRKELKYAESRADDLTTLLAAQKAVATDLDNWSERFDTQDTMEKKSMLINLIDRITVSEEEIEVEYTVPFDYSWEDVHNSDLNDKKDRIDPFFCSNFVQGDTQSKTHLCL